MRVAQGDRYRSRSAVAAILVCPSNVQKDDVMRRGLVYCAKLAGDHSMFVAPRLISHLAAICMPHRKDEPEVLSDAAQRVLKVLRREHELATADLRAESHRTCGIGLRL